MNELDVKDLLEEERKNKLKKVAEYLKEYVKIQPKNNGELKAIIGYIEEGLYGSAYRYKIEIEEIKKLAKDLLMQRKPKIFENILAILDE